MTAEVTGSRGPDDRGTYMVITRAGFQVVHHTKLTLAERDAIVADPTRAHERAWAVVPLRQGGRRA